MKVYGNLINRLEENQNYKANKLIEVGDDVTKYMYSDRVCYYVTKVENQKHIWIKRYEVIADKTKEGGMGHQNWVYIKDPSRPEIELKFTYGKWREKGISYSGKEFWNPFGNLSFGIRDYYYDWEF